MRKQIGAVTVFNRAVKIIKTGTLQVDVEHASGERANEDMWGAYVPCTSTIFLREEMGEEQMWEVLCHELIHAIHISCHVDLDERDVQLMGIGLRGILESFFLEDENEKVVGQDKKDIVEN